MQVKVPRRVRAAGAGPRIEAVVSFAAGFGDGVLEVAVFAAVYVGAAV